MAIRNSFRVRQNQFLNEKSSYTLSYGSANSREGFFFGNFLGLILGNLIFCEYVLIDRAPHNIIDRTPPGLKAQQQGLA